MKNKTLYILIAVLLVISIIITAVAGLKVDLYLGEGYNITVTEKDTVEVNEIKQIAKEVWGSDVLVQKIEFFDDSVVIKVKEVDDEKLTQLKDKLNEKYSSELETSSFNVEHVSNIKLRRVIEPYIIPMVLSTLLIMGFYAIRYRGARRMMELLLLIIFCEGLLFSIHAIARLPICSITLPISVIVFVLAVMINTLRLENNKEE